MISRDCEIELLTPCFCAGCEKQEPEIRVPSLRGQLRFWSRVRSGSQKMEYGLFGGVQGKKAGVSPDQDVFASRFVFRMTDQVTNIRRNELMCPHDPRKGRRDAVAEESRFKLSWFQRFRNDQNSGSEMDQVVRTWLFLGGLGARSNRAAGSVWTAGYRPTLAVFADEVRSLGLPSTVKVFVVGVASRPEELRKIATDTIHGHGENWSLGYVDGRNRKASPLKLKVGAFEDGFRLVVVWDNRDRRGGDLQSSVDSLIRGKKKLGEWLAHPVLSI